MPPALDTSHFANQQIARLLERLASQVHQAIRSATADAVHDLRVAIRRYKQAITAFREYLPSRNVKRIRRSLKYLMGPAGEVRNCDIAMKKLAKLRSEDGPPLREKLQAHRKLSAAKLATALKQWEARQSAAKWRAALLPAEPPKSCSYPILDDHAHHELPRVAKCFRKAGNRAADPDASATQLHRCRIQAKEVRYTLELFAPLYGPPAEEWLARMRDVQTLLGDINDCRTMRELVDELGGSDDIERRLKKTQRKKTADFQKLWNEQFAPAAMRDWIHELRTPPRKPMARSRSAGQRSVSAAAL
jgi:CHAD domain-containing protein